MAGPFLVGTLKHVSGDYMSATLVLAGIMAVGAVFACILLPIISPDSTLQLRHKNSSSSVSPHTGGTDGGPQDGRIQHGSRSLDGKSELTSNGGLQLVPLRSPC